MSQKRKTKEEIVAEYLTGNYPYRELGIKYGIPFRSICDWVLEYQGSKPSWREKMKRKREKETGTKEPELSNEVKLPQKECSWSGGYGIRAITEALKIQSPAIAQINNLNFALGGISGQIAAIADQQRNWTIIDDFEDVTEQAIEFSASLTEEVTEERNRQSQILLTLVSAFVKKYGVQGLLSIDIILRFAGFHQYYDFLQQKPELPTKQEVNLISIKQGSVIQVIGAMNEQLKIAKEYRITNRHCDVKLKPKTKTLTVSKLPKRL